MTEKETKIRKYVMQYDVDVPQEKVEDELKFIRQDMIHRMRYENLSGGQKHLFPAMELEEQDADILEAAVYEVKSELVLNDIIEKQGFTVTKEELEIEAAAIAQRQNTTIELIKKFFGEDLEMLESDVKKNKSIDWICEQTI